MPRRLVSSRRCGRATLAVLAPLLLSLSAGVPAAAGAQETLSLRFAWPEGSARVTTENEVATNAPMMPGGGGETSTFMAATITVTSHPEGYRISYSDYDFGNGLGFPELEDVSALQGEEMMRFLQGAQQASGDILVSPEGDYLGLVDPAQLDPIMDAMDELLSSLAAQAPMAPLTDMREQMLDVSTWERMGAVGWETQVTKWRGDWVRGEVRTDSTAFPNPMGGGDILMLEELSWEGTEPCPDGSGECAVMVGSSASGDDYLEQVRTMMADMMAEMGAGAEMAVDILELDMRQTSRLHLRRDTMAPVSMVTTVEVRQKMAAMGMEMAMEQSQVSRTNWDWSK